MRRTKATIGGVVIVAVMGGVGAMQLLTAGDRGPASVEGTGTGAPSAVEPPTRTPTLEPDLPTSPEPEPVPGPEPAPTPGEATGDAAPAAPVEIAYRVEVRTPDPAVAGFPAVVDATLGDARGWSQAGFAFVRRDDAPHRIVLAEGAEVDALCLPYDTYGQYSCQNGPVVAINADRWRAATPKWTGDLHSYRVMLVNHEVGHLLGQRHTDCPEPGVPAPIMVQQSTELRGCLPNPWPLPWETAVAARHDQPIAPRYGE